MTTPTRYPSFGLQRRHLLGGVLAAGAVQLAPLSWAAAPAEPTASGAFLALSQYLTERSNLSPRMAARLQAGWQALDSAFAANVEALWQWLQTNQVSLAQLNARLKAEQPALAAVPGQVMQAWYLGIVGSGREARALAYEFALNAQTVADKLRPPTYAYGVYGSWSHNPASYQLQRLPVQA